MKKLLILTLLSLLLAACRPLEEAPAIIDAATGVPQPAITVAAEPSPTLDLPVPTSTSAPGRPPGVELSSSIEGPPMDGCTLQTALRPPDATEASLFPAVSSSDWRIGPDDASTTIVEYGDFQ